MHAGGRHTRGRVASRCVKNWHADTAARAQVRLKRKQKQNNDYKKENSNNNNKKNKENKIHKPLTCMQAAGTHEGGQRAGA